MVGKVPLRKAIVKLDVAAIIAFGNPLLDIFISLQNKDLLTKYNLTVDGETELPMEKMQELLADLPLELITFVCYKIAHCIVILQDDSLINATVQTLDIAVRLNVYIENRSTKLKCRRKCTLCIHVYLSPLSEQYVSAGGSAQNSLRILQWLCDETFQKRYSIFCGGLGNDSRGAILENLVRSAGVDARYAIQPTLPTGHCIALTNESSRSLVANIGAAAVYTSDDLKKSNLSLDRVKIIYIEGFFITHSFPVAKQLLKEAEERNIIVAFNLNGTYIFNDHHVAICEMVGYANIVFGNAREMEALAQSLNVTYDDVTDIPFLLNSLKRITVNVSNITNEDWLRHGGVFVMSQGDSAPAIAVWGRSQSVQVQPIIPNAPVVDTTGAGDSLVAGFLAGVLAQWEPKHCLEYGCKVASFMVTRLGVTLPDNVPPDLLE